MPEQQATAGTFCWTELMTRDLAAAKKFYADLLGWRTVDENLGGAPYTMFYVPGQKEAVGGMMQMSGPQFEGVPPHWMPYILVKDIDDRASRCKQLGGKIKVPPMDIPSIGRFCVIEDPTGAVISLFQGKAM
jgi:predicted enzyme related to lactoylglutathione lyase